MRKHSEINYCQHCRANALFTWDIDIEGKQPAHCSVCGTEHYRVIDADLRTRILESRAK